MNFKNFAMWAMVVGSAMISPWCNEVDTKTKESLHHEMSFWRQKHATDTQHYENWQVQIINEYENGELVSTKRYDEDWQLFMEIGYENGEIVSTKRYDKYGLIMESEYKNGEIVSTKQYDEDWQLFIEIGYENGEIVATKYYNENGHLRWEISQKDGTIKRYDENGQLISVEKNKNIIHDDIMNRDTNRRD